MPERKNTDMDVIIIGSGGAALSAAIEACSAMARVAMVEKEEGLGGTSIVSGGGCWMVGTPMQEFLGIHDSPDEAFEDWVKWGKGAFMPSSYFPWHVKISVASRPTSNAGCLTNTLNLSRAYMRLGRWPVWLEDISMAVRVSRAQC